MHRNRRRYSLTLLTLAVLTACQSAPRSLAPHSPQADASGALVAMPPAPPAPEPAPAAPPPPLAAYQNAGAHLDRISVSGTHARAQAAEQRARHAASPALAAKALMLQRQAPLLAEAQATNTENYASRDDNPVQRASEQPVSTFSVDVDTGSYSNVRRMLQDGQRPPADAVRAEEFINYFRYGHAAPSDRSTPFKVTTELAPAPWDARRQLLMVGIKGYDVPKSTLPPANLVFLIDTSGSMNSPDKLPLAKEALRHLLPQLRAQDRVSIVVYAGSAGVVLPPTPGDRQGEIRDALERLRAGGSTNGGEGIQLAYAMARQAYVRNGVNRVILATDGDFNVGVVNQKALETLVGDQRKSGIALTTLGFGQGNYNDAMAERLADVGDGNHAYIDSAQEARKVLADEMQATLLTIARDVKVQVEFNPAAVSEYRLIGYENRLLQREDFANDKVDAGDIGAGHEVTAVYEITPVGSGAERLPALRYGKAATAGSVNANELAHLRLRYKLPDAQASHLIETPILRSALRQQPSEALGFASAVAAYADLLRGGTHIGNWSWNDVAQAARATRGPDANGLRREFVDLVERAHGIVNRDTSATAVASGD